MSPEAQEFYRQAVQALQDNQFERAVELADKALGLEPIYGDALMIKGIALARSGQPDAATTAFRTAIANEPANPKAYYNLATHLYQIGNKVEAQTMAGEALRLDPRHGAARDLITLIEQEQRAASEVVAPPPSEPNPYAESPYARRGYQQPRHAIAFVEALGAKWMTLGWVLVVASAVILILSFVQLGPALIDMFSQMASNPDAVDPNALQVNTNPLLQFFGYALPLASLIWMVMDLADRRGNWLWMIPFVLCCCCGLSWIVQPIYMLVGRKDI